MDTISEERLINNRGREVKDERFERYRKAIIDNRILPFINDAISSSKSGTVIIKVDDLKKEMGPYFENLSNTSIHWGLRFVLFYEDIIIRKARIDDGSKVFIMRRKMDTDELPDSLKTLTNVNIK